MPLKTKYTNVRFEDIPVARRFQMHSGPHWDNATYELRARRTYTDTCNDDSQDFWPFYFKEFLCNTVD